MDVGIKLKKFRKKIGGLKIGKEWIGEKRKRKNGRIGMRS